MGKILFSNQTLQNMSVTEIKKQELVYGTRVSPFTGDHEVTKGRIVIYQDEFRELSENILLRILSVGFLPQSIFSLFLRRN